MMIRASRDRGGIYLRLAGEGFYDDVEVGAAGLPDRKLSSIEVRRKVP